VRFAVSFTRVVAACALMFSPGVSMRSIAQSIPQTPVTLPSWGGSNEIVVSGTVDSTINERAEGRPGGVNVRINNTRGTMEANFGPHPPATLTKLLTLGQAVTLTGAALNNSSSAMLVRTVNIGGQTYVVRNMKGLPTKPAATGLQANRGRQGSFGGGQ